MNNLYRFLAFIGALFVVGPVRAQAPAPHFMWGRDVRTTALLSSAQIRHAVADPFGNVYALAESAHSLTVGGVTYPQISHSRTQVLVKYDSAGQILWQKRLQQVPQIIPSYGYETIEQLLTDSHGNLILLGNGIGLSPNQFQLFGTDTLVALDGGGFFLAKIDPTGQPIWARTPQAVAGTGSGGGDGYYAALGPNDDIYLTGRTSAQYEFRFDTIRHPVATPSASIRSPYVARLASANGQARWARICDRYSYRTFRPYPQGLRTDAAGNAYLCIPAVRLEMDSIRLQAVQWRDTAMWLKLAAADGRALAGRVLPLETEGYHNPMAVDPAGNTYLTMWAPARTTVQIPPVPGAPPQPYPIGPNTGILKLNPAGAVEWSSPLLQDWDYNLWTSLECDRQGHLYLASLSIRQGYTYPGLDTIPSGDAFVARLDPATGHGETLTRVGGHGGERIETLCAGPSGMLTVGGVSTSDTLRLGQELVIGQATRDGKGYVGVMSQQYNLLRGAVFVDQNGNNLHDPGEGNYAFGSVVEMQPGGRLFAPTAAGYYVAPVGVGMYQMSLAEVPRYHTLTALPPASTTFNGLGQTAPGASFALHPVPGQQDLQVLLTSGPAVENEYLTMGLTFRNVGTVVMDSGSVTLDYDSAMSLDRITRLIPTARGAHRLVWRFGRLRPGESGNAILDFRVNYVPTDSLVNCTARITPLVGDLTPADNVATTTEPVFPETALFRLDTTTVSQRQMPVSQVRSGEEWLTYTARFQNPGADSAYRVTVRDSLPLELRRGTVDVLNASHPVEWTLSETGVLSIRLDGARLPGVAAGAGRLGAFVQFRLKPATTLPVGTLIRQQPQIFFDGRLGLTLPEATTEVVPDPLGAPVAGKSLGGSIWPNPATDVLNVRVPLPTTGAFRVQLRDATGRLVREVSLTAPSGEWHGRLSTAGLPNGLYWFDATTSGGGRFCQSIVIAR